MTDMSVPSLPTGHNTPAAGDKLVLPFSYVADAVPPANAKVCGGTIRLILWVSAGLQVNDVDL